MAVQVARARGARVIGTASSAEKCRVIADLGATAIDYTKGDWVKEVLAATGGRGADLILESVGGEVFLRSFREALARFGRMVVFGAASREIVPIDNREILGSNRTLTGYYLGDYFPAHLDRIITATMKLVGLMQEGKVKPIGTDREQSSQQGAAPAPVQFWMPGRAVMLVKFSRQPASWSFLSV